MTTSELQHISGGRKVAQVFELTVCYGPTLDLPGFDTPTLDPPAGGTVFFPKF